MLRCLLPLFAGIAACACLGQDPVRIALISDPHTTRGTKDDQPLYRGRFDETIQQVNAAKVDVALIAGDLTQGGLAVEVADFKQEVARLTMPVLWVPGNHDVGNKRIPGKEGGVTQARVETYEQRLGESFFSRTIAGIRFIGLNSSILGSGLPREEQMWTFFDAQMAAPFAGPTIVFMHYPPYVNTADEPGGGYWNIEPESRARLLAALQRGGVKILLTGHLHYQATNHYEGMLIVTTAAVSFGIPHPLAPEGWTLVTMQPKGDPKIEFHRVQ